MAWKDYEALDVTPERATEEIKKFYGHYLPEVSKFVTDKQIKWASEQLCFSEELRGGIISLREELEELL